MFRLLGAITGSALALAALLLVIGIPQFRTESPGIERAIVKLPRVSSAVDAVQAPDAVSAIPANAVGPPMPADGEAAAATPDVAVTADIAAPADAPAEAVPALAGDARDWYAFWSPFRSELAAAGFVSQLQRVTGLDYRVVKVKAGVYEVAFAYRDDADIDVNLSQITAATGLEMAER